DLVARRIRLGGAFFRRGGGSILLTGTILGRSGLGTAGVGRRFLLRIVLRRRSVFTALVFSGSGLRQRRGIVRKRPQIGDYIGAVLNILQACERHRRAWHEAFRIE